MKKILFILPVLFLLGGCDLYHTSGYEYSVDYVFQDGSTGHSTCISINEPTISTNTNLFCGGKIANGVKLISYKRIRKIEDVRIY